MTDTDLTMKPAASSQSFYGSRYLKIIVLLSVSSSESLQPPSLLAGTQWKVRLDVGLQPGTWMPKRFPGWAESGARLGLDVKVDFTNEPSATRESLVGPKDSTFRLKVASDLPSTFVSERGQEEVDFADGGWCIQRPTGNVKNARGSLVKPEGLLRFWLDCPSGAKRRDVEIRPNTRIFFTTGVWDFPDDLQKQDGEYKEVLAELQVVVDQTREARNTEGNILEEMRTYQKMIGDSKGFERLKDRKETLERELPPMGASVAPNGVQIAPTGSLVIKGNSIPDWLPGSEYLILGTFSASAV
mmetsp:Transcript_23251/g.68767  ORF Transcript_23251/g.68767 Transcript_23251/m.68767 type:complete len:300 (-) Transcript_23251:85-984(-)